MVDHTDTQVFDSNAQAPSNSHGENENGHKGIQDAAPFDDTVVLDCPLVETQLMMKLDFGTQVVDGSDCFEEKSLQSFCEYEKEVVLDSEDEGVSRTYTLHADNLLLDSNASISKLCSVVEGEKGCRVAVERTNMQKDLVIGSQEPGDSSQADALEFVDKFLSLNKMDLSPECGMKKTVGEKSPPFSSVKWSQSLAKRLKFRKTPVTKSAKFEWVDNDQHGKVDVFGKRTKASFEFGAVRQESVLKDHKAMHVNGEGGRSSGNENEKRKELVNLHKEIAGSTHSDPKDDCTIEQVSKVDIKNHSDKDINEDLHVESSDQQLDGCGTGIDTLDMFDVGFNTQIAAEAMEALSYAPFSGCTAFNPDQGQSNTTNDFLKGVIMKKARSEQALIQTSNFCGLGSIAMKSKRRKCSARKSPKNSNKVRDPELPRLTKMRRGKSLIGEQFDCSANTNGNSGNGSPTLIIKGQAVGIVGKNNKVKEYENHTTSSILIEQEEVGLRNITVAQESRQSLAGGALKRTKKQSDNPRDWMEDGTIKFRRKRSRLVGNPTDVMSANGSWSTLHSDSLAEPKSNIFDQKEETDQEMIALTSCLNLATGGHPKGKRTLREMQSHSNGAKEGNRSYMKSQGGAKYNSNTSFYKDMKGKPQSVNDSSPLNLPEKDLGKYFDEPGSAVPFANNESAIISKEISPGKYLEPPGSGNTSTINFTKGTNASSSSHVPSKYHRKPLIRNLPKSSLLKELIRLDVPELIPDFTWKDLRRRRDMSHVRVLFSQHLDDDVIKRQKKQISARLGISIATCPGDATHFIADRFVRTRNMMETIALGKPVVTHLWLESCGQASCLIDEKNYILRDAKKEREIGFSMPVTYARASHHPLLKGQRVFITTSIKPDKEMITGLVKAVHGQVIDVSQVSAVKEEKFQENPLILSCEEDHAICVPFLDKGIAAYSSELLLNGIVIQKLEFERYQLFKYIMPRGISAE
ncbi:hypothetical protein AB3S75_026082 [Citrus x aurantiifolia]